MLHNGQPLLRNQLETELYIVITGLVFKLRKINAKFLLEDILLLIKNHLSNLAAHKNNKTVINEQEYIRIQIVETCVRNVLESFKVGNKLTCMSVYDTLSKILTHQVKFFPEIIVNIRYIVWVWV